MAKKKVKSLDWEYCECGCKGSDFTLGNTRYWHRIEFGDGYKISSIVLRKNGQGFMGSYIGTFKTMQEVDDVVRADLKEQMKLLSAALK